MSRVLQAVNKQGKQGDVLYAKRQSSASSPEPRQPIPAGKLSRSTYLLVYWKVRWALHKNPPLAPRELQTPMETLPRDQGLCCTQTWCREHAQPHLSYLTVQVSQWCTPHVSDCKEQGEMWRSQQSPTKRIGKPSARPCGQHLSLQTQYHDGK